MHDANPQPHCRSTSHLPNLPHPLSQRSSHLQQFHSNLSIRQPSSPIYFGHQGKSLVASAPDGPSLPERPPHFLIFPPLCCPNAPAAEARAPLPPLPSLQSHSIAPDVLVCQCYTMPQWVRAEGCCSGMKFVRGQVGEKAVLCKMKSNKMVKAKGPAACTGRRNR